MLSLLSLLLTKIYVVLKFYVLCNCKMATGPEWSIVLTQKYVYQKLLIRVAIAEFALHVHSELSDLVLATLC